MESVETLKRLAREGDLKALQKLRDMGFFKKNGSATPKPLRKKHLSQHQERLWFIDVFEAGILYESSPLYHNIPLILHLQGPVKAEFLEEGLNTIISRHEPLHTRIITEDNQAFQIINPAEGLKLKVINVEAEWDGVSIDPIVELGLKEALTPFVLNQDLLVRAVLLKASEIEFILAISVHHLVADIQSMKFIADELFEIYGAQIAGRAPRLPEVKYQYVDYLEWRLSLGDEWMEPLLLYWKAQLRDELQALKLPETRPRPAVHTFTGARRNISFGKEVTQGIAQFAAAEQVDLFAALLAGFKVMLRRYSGLEEIVVGTSVPCRNQPGIENSVGPFANLLVLRSEVSGNPTLRAFVVDVSEMVEQARKHQEMRWDQLVKELDPWRDMSRIALIDVLFQFEDREPPHQDLGPVKARAIETNLGYGKYDLNFSIFRDRDGLSGVAAYNTDIYDASLIDQMLSHFKVVLEALVVDPNQRVEEIFLLSGVEQQQQLSEWNATERDYPKDKCVHELFEAQAGRKPDAVAMVCGEKQLSYRELNEQANQLARYLRTLGVGPEVLVGIFMDRSVELVVAALGVLKAGGAYVPIDPQNPFDRLSTLLNDIQAPVLLTQESLLERLPTTGGYVLCLDTQWNVLAQERKENLENWARAENLAYVIHTSGSTGQPKGVEVLHGGLLNLVCWHLADYEIGCGDRATLVAGVGFDASVWELWPYLAAGASIYIPLPEIRSSPPKLRDWLIEKEITMSFLPTPLAEAVLGLEWPKALALRVLLTGGDRLKRYLSDAVSFEVVNHYGPTETTVVATGAKVPVRQNSTVNPPIGRPIANTRIYILDQYGEHVPVGVSAELHIGGCGVARGYLNGAELTAEKFVPDRFGQEPGQRLYKTGDLVRYLPDGNLEFIGRIDQQVKVRGFRIELGEIETRLAEHPAVREGVVLVREDTPDNRQIVGYMVLEEGQNVAITELKSYLKERLPEYMVPSFFVMLDSLPMTPNGKVDRKALPAPEGRQIGETYIEPQSELEKTISSVWQECLGVEQVGIYDNFFDLGGHSLLVVRVQDRLQQIMKRKVEIVELFQFPTVQKLAQHLSNKEEPFVHTIRERAERQQKVGHDSIAVIGMAGRFPGAKDIKEFWRNLQAGKESISFFTDEELKAAGFSEQILRNPDFVKAKGVLEGVELFDAGFFGYSPREAEIIDPQQRVFLEAVWEALEHAGYDAERYAGAIGLYAGSSINTYALTLFSDRELMASIDPFQVLISSDKDFLCTRVSYKLNLRGPSLNVQTACSTSLVAVHLACKSLLNGECDIALAGGVSITDQQKGGYLYREGGVLSPDGHCRAFEARAQGTVRGSGVGVVVLKRLSEALADGDTIHAVIKGSASNNDGSSKVGYTAPSVSGQAEVIAIAQALSGVDAQSISYVEAHGTGTVLGDPIEIAGLTQAFGGGRDGRKFCAIGSVKTNIGHLDAAAGVTSLIKTILALKHQKIPPSLHFEKPNPKINFADSPFYVNTALTDWPVNGGPRRAGVSSFGIGGTNAHAVLEEAPPAAPSGVSRKHQLLVLSARTAHALEQSSADLLAHLKAEPETNLADVAYTLQTGRKVFNQRRIVVCGNLDEAIRALEMSAGAFSSTADAKERGLVFMFSGQGSQYVKMGWELYEQEPVFREQVDKCCELLKPELGLDLRQVIYPEVESRENEQQLQQTSMAQPALFVIEYALAKLWMSWGIEPQAMIGHSIGEYVAACLAGVFSLEEALGLVAIRGRLMQEQPAGAMLSLELSGSETEKLLCLTGLVNDLSLAAVNGPCVSVVSGPTELIGKFESELSARKLVFQRLRTSHAFHSVMMEPMLEPFLKHVRKIKLRAPVIPYVSNLTGKWITEAEATDPTYWGRHLRQTVRFSEGMEEVIKNEEQVFLEVGPGQALSRLAKGHVDKESGHVIASMRHRDDLKSDDAYLLNALGQLWLSGVKVKWSGFYAQEQRRRVPLPTYPFERQRYWIDPRSQSPGKAFRLDDSGRRTGIDDWFYVPYWNRFALSSPANPSRQNLRWLIFVNEADWDRQLLTGLKENGQEILVVKAGVRFARLQGGVYTIRPAEREDYESLIKDLHAQNRMPERVLHLWSAESGKKKRHQLPETETFKESQQSGFYSLLFLSQALASQKVVHPLQLDVITSGVQAVEGREVICPDKATVLGPCKVIPQEYLQITCRTIDVQVPAAKAGRQSQIKQIIAELQSVPTDRVVAYREQCRWVQTFVMLPRGREAWQRGAERLRPGGVYLITGGLGNIGLLLAQYLFKTQQGKLILVGRSTLPPREEWGQWLDTHAEGDLTSQKLLKLQQLEKSGAEMLILSADVADENQMSAVWAQAEEQFGSIHGVIHAAGLGAAIPIPETKPAQCNRQFEPKIQGLYALEKIIKDKQLDFCLLTSSLASILGGLGFTAHAAANAFMDAFAQKQNQTSAFPWICVNWDGWDFREDLSEGTQAITVQDSAEAFTRIFSACVGTAMAVSTYDLQGRIEKWVNLQTVLKDESTEGNPLELHKRPDISSPYVAPTNKIEQSLAKLWRELLGIQEIGIHDDFFELGGHSLLATQLISRMREAFKADLPLRSLFEAPTIAGLSRRVKEACADEAAQQAPPIVRTPRNGKLPLSYAQERLWFLDQLEPGSIAYIMSIADRIQGHLDVKVLERVINEIIRRHEVLRTTFEVSDEWPVQVVHPVPGMKLEVVNLQGMDSSEQQLQIERLAQQEAQQPFDLAKGQLVRLKLVRLQEAEQVLFFTMHHIISDGWSMGVLVREFGQLYEAFASGRQSPLPELPIQYADYAVWQRQWLQGEVLEKQLSYWKKQLGGVAQVLQLPTDRPRPAVPTHSGAAEEMALSRELSTALEEMSRREGGTAFMLLLAAFKVLLFRYTGQTDLLVGTPIANRNRAEIEGLIGFFVNTLVLRSSLSGDPTFLELLAREREVALGAFDHQDVPFEQLVHALQPERNLNHSPLFQVTFVLETKSGNESKAPGLRLQPIGSETRTAKFDLSLSLFQTDQGLVGGFEYNTDLFEGATIRRLAGHFGRLLEGIAGDPNRRLSELELLSAEEREQLVVGWNRTGAEYPREQCIHELVEAQVERSPEAVALVFEEQTLSYRELNVRANQLAHYLRGLGVGPEVLVGIYVERSLEMVVGLLGILKAGGAYVPLDPDYPKERLRFMLENARVPVMLTQERWVENLPEHKGRVLCLDRDWHAIAECEHSNPVNATCPASAVYAIYTSGSTGRPKGAVNTHQGLCNRLVWMQNEYQLEAEDCVLQKTPFSFDVSVWEFFWPLLVGARLVVAQPGGHKDPGYLVKTICQERISTLHFVPSMLQVFLEEPGIKRCTSLKRVICSGEALSRELQDKFFRRLAASLHNLYGPTEASIDVTYWECQQGSALRTVPIGRPIANTRIYVLDGNLQLVPLGVGGELQIGGEGLARGYLDQPELTAERFIPDPFSREPGGRLYRTGDLVRYLPGGEIEYLGRMDHQVKLRGFRIELGEIEARLAEHAAVRETVVLLREDEPGQKRLVGYVALQEGLGVSVSELRDHVRRSLPEYMVPAAIMVLVRLPLTANGKVDRKALPAPDRSRADVGEYAAPRNKGEELLVGIWKQILKLERVGIQDNFFEAGGHSLLATVLVSKIQEAFGIDFPLRSLFESPTIAGLADNIGRIFWEGASGLSWSPLVPIKPRGERKPLFLVHPFTGRADPYARMAKYLAPDQPLYGIQAPVDIERVTESEIQYASLEEMAAHYIQVISTVEPSGPYLLGGYSYGGNVAFEMAQQLLALGREVHLLAIIDSAPSFEGLGSIDSLDDSEIVIRRIRTLEAANGIDELPFERLSEFEGEERLKYTVEQLHESGRLPSHYNLTMIKAMVHRTRARMRCLERYVPRVYPGKLNLFRSTEEDFPNEIAGWRRLSRKPFQVIYVPGDHHSIVKEPGVQELARKLQGVLTRLQTKKKSAPKKLKATGGEK